VFIIGTTQTSGEWLWDEKRDHLFNRTRWLCEITVLFVV